MSFVEMGAHRFELCLAQEPLAPQGKAGMLRIGFLLTETAMDELIQQLRRSETPLRRAGNLPSGSAARSNHSGTGCGRQHPRILGPQTGRSLVIAYEDISHLAMEVTDLNAAERFYAGALGMELICRDSGEQGNGRLILKNGSGQLLFLEKVDEMSQRSRFSGPDSNNVPDPGGGLRYKGAHLAMSVASMADYDEVYDKLEAHGAYQPRATFAPRSAPPARRASTSTTPREPAAAYHPADAGVTPLQDTRQFIAGQSCACIGEPDALRRRCGHRRLAG